MKRLTLILATFIIALASMAKDITITNMTTSDYRGFMGVFGFSGNNDEYNVSLGVYTSDEITGHYEGAQIAYCTLSLVTTYENITLTAAEADVTKGENGYQVTARLVDSSNETYNIQMALVVPDPIRTVNLDFTESAERMKNYNLVMYTATKGDLQFHLAFTSAVADGEYGVNELSTYYTYLENTADETSVSLLNAKAVVKTEGDMTRITVDFLGSDTVQYLVSMFYKIPERRTETVHVTNMAQIRHYDDYDYQIMGSDGKHRVALDIITDQLEGEYTLYDFYLSGTFVVHYNEFGEETGTSYPEEAEATITVVGDTTYIKANLLCDDNVLYQVDMWYALPTVKQTVDFTVTDYDVEDNTVEYGDFQMQGISTDGRYYISLAVYADQATGSFTESRLEGAYSLIQNTVTTDIAYILSAKFTVYVDESGKLAMTGSFLCDDGVMYNVRMGNMPSSIAAAPSQDKCDTTTYDLMGRRVAPDTRGILIRNGKKIFVK